MASSKAAWGIEVGAGAVKAIRLERTGQTVQITDFAFIEHKKVLTTPDLDQNEVIRLSLGQLISQKNFENQTIVMSVPGHSALARFAKLPPVEPNKIPDIVKFEAVQQIPFPIDQVEWDYQTFSAPDSPEVEVGIFAITKEKINDRLTLYAELGLQPEIVTVSPLAVYNAISYDLTLDANKPLVVLDIGTSASDLIVAHEGKCWVRTFPLGGHHFTEALEQAFSLSYSKADRLKQESATSQYAKQMMQAMRPVFGDLLQEVQRSLGHYQTLHREANVDQILGVGSTFKIPGLRKFLGQQLQVDVARMDEFKKIRVEGREAADFAAHCVSFATAYGLALQGVGLAKISVNLSPVKSIREKLWSSKTKWFGAAAALALVAGVAMTARPMLEKLQMPADMPQVSKVKSQGKGFVDQYRTAQGNSDVGFVAENMRRLLGDREIWPYLVHDAFDAIHASQPNPVEVNARDIDEILVLPASERNLIQLEDLSGQYEAKDGKRYVHVEMKVAFAERAQALTFLNATAGKWLRDHAEPTGARKDVPYRILTSATSPELAAGPAGGGARDPGKPDGGEGDRFTEPPPPPPSEPASADQGGGAPPGGSAPGGTQAPAPTGAGRRGVGGSGVPAGGIQAPGSGVKLGGASGGGGEDGKLKGFDGPKPPSGRDDPPDVPPVNPDELKKDEELDKIAPIPGLPGIFSTVKYHRGVIRFTVEIRDPNAPAAGAEPKPEGKP